MSLSPSASSAIRGIRRTTAFCAYRALSPTSGHSAEVRYCICHGGSGTLLGALAYGKPLLIIPLSGDHFPSAERLAALEVAQVLHVPEVTIESVRTTVHHMLTTARIKNRRPVSRKISTAMPSPNDVARILEAQWQTWRTPACEISLAFCCILVQRASAAAEAVNQQETSQMLNSITLSLESLRAIGSWAADCAERALSCIRDARWFGFTAPCGD